MPEDIHLVSYYGDLHACIVKFAIGHYRYSFSYSDLLGNKTATKLNYDLEPVTT